MTQPQPPEGMLPGTAPGAPPVPPSAWSAVQIPGPPPGYYAQPVQRQTMNGLAIASMVLGIIWVYWIGSILALVFGYIAKKQIDESNGTQNGRGMAIAGIVLGWVGIGTLVLIIVIAMISAASGNNDSSSNGMGLPHALSLG
jgi:Domain of unknown function (DUF4190)